MLLLISELQFDCDNIVIRKVPHSGSPIPRNLPAGIEIAALKEFLTDTNQNKSKSFHGGANKSDS